MYHGVFQCPGELEFGSEGAAGIRFKPFFFSIRGIKHNAALCFKTSVSVRFLSCLGMIIP